MKTLHYCLKALLLFTIFTFSACLKDTIDELSAIKGVKVTSNYSLPIIDINVGMEEIYESITQNAGVKKNPDNSIIFTFNTSDTIGGSEFVAIPPVPFDFNFQMSPAVIAAFEFQNGFNLTLKDSAKLPSASGELLESIAIKSGSFTIAINNTFKHRTKIVIKFPGLTRNGVPLQDSIQMNYESSRGSAPIIVNRSFNLAGYIFDLSRNGTTNNTIDFEYVIGMERIIGNTTTTGDALALSQNITINEYSNVRGYLGRFPILKAAEAQKFEIFEKGISGKVFIDNPKLVVRVSNSFGIPITGRINNIRVTTNQDVDIPITIAPFQDTFTFNYPTVIGQTAVSEWVIDKSNSNLNDAINASPSFIKYDLDFTSNINNIVRENFILDNSRFIANIDVEVPVDVKIVDYEILQSNKKSVSNTEVDVVDQMKLYIRAKNGLPFDVFTQIVFLKDSILLNNTDTILVVADSLFASPWPILAAQINSQGNVISSTESVFTTIVTKKRFENIQASKQFNVVSRMRSSAINGEPAFVRIYTDQKLSLKLATDARLIYQSK